MSIEEKDEVTRDYYERAVRNGEPVIDGSDPTGIEHLCIKDLQIHDGPVEECCENEWREERAALD